MTLPGTPSGVTSVGTWAPDTGKPNTCSVMPSLYHRPYSICNGSLKSIFIINNTYCTLEMFCKLTVMNFLYLFQLLQIMQNIFIDYRYACIYTGSFQYLISIMMIYDWTCMRLLFTPLCSDWINMSCFYFRTASISSVSSEADSGILVCCFINLKNIIKHFQWGKSWYLRNDFNLWVVSFMENQIMSG